jgi:hypothetical protein
MARIGADQQDRIGVFDAIDGGIEEIARPAMRWIQSGAILRQSMLGDPARPSGLERKHFFNTGQITGKRADLFRFGCDRLVGDRSEGLAPAEAAQLAAIADVGPVETLRAQTVPDEAGLVGNPLFVDRLVERAA